MVTWEPIDISQSDRDDTEDVYDEWDNDFKSNLEIRFNRLRVLDETLNESTDEDNIEMTEKAKNKFKRGTIKLVANKIYDRLINLFNKNGKRIINYDNFKLADDGELTYVDKRTVIDLGNIDEGLKSPWEIRKLGVKN